MSIPSSPAAPSSSGLGSSPFHQGSFEDDHEDGGVAEHDSLYECDAPKFADFRGLQQTPGASDSWFDRQKDTPFSEREYEVDPLYDPTRDDEEEEQDEYDPEKTPIANKKARESTDLLDENTPTPRVKSRTQPFQEDFSYESAEKENAVDEVTDGISNLRTRPFTPVRPSTLYASTTWSDLETEEPETKAPVPVAKPAPVSKAKAFVPTRSVKPLTIPVEFKFSHRKPKLGHTVSPAEPTKDLPQTSKSQRPNVTVPKPFRFHSATSRVRSHSVDVASDKSPFIPLALRVKEFEKTPDRFKPGHKVMPPRSTNNGPLKVTKPKPPTFQTDNRMKKKATLTSEEKELQELKSRPMFKATPLDTRIMNSHGDYGVPRIKKLATTVPYSPKILKPKTKPVHVETNQTSVRAHPYIPSKPFQVKIESREIQPIDYKLPGDEISQRKREKFLEAQRLEEQARKVAFKARPIINDPPPVPPQQVARLQEITLPHSPMLLTKQRGKQYQEMMARKLQEEEIKAKKQAEFKAGSVPELDVPFLPEPSDKLPTEVLPIILNTEMRAEERKIFDMQMMEREEELEAMRARKMHEDELREKEEVRRLRREMEFKAQDMKLPVPFEPKKSDKPLTEPISPYIGDKRRLFMPQN